MNIDTSDCYELALALRLHNCLTHLVLQMNDLRDEGVANLMGVVSGSKSLVHLDLSSTCLSPKGF